MRADLQVHFLKRHIRDNIVLLEEGNLPHPRCPHCDILVPWEGLNSRHPNTTQCTKREDLKWHRLAAEEMRLITERAF